MKQILFIIAVAVVVFISFNMFETPNKLGLKVEPTLVPPVLSDKRNAAADATPAAPDAANAKASQITAEQFIASFNQLSKDQGRDFALTNVTFEDKTDHMAFDYMITPEITLIALLDKEQKLVDAVSVIDLGDEQGNISEDAAAILDVIVAALDSKLSPADRADLLTKLGIASNTAASGAQGTDERNGISYTTTGNDAVGMLFTATLFER